MTVIMTFQIITVLHTLVVQFIENLHLRVKES